VALNLSTQYPGKVTAPSAAYPFGGAQNVTVPNDGTGTPWEAALINDYIGLLQALLGAAGLTPSGAPDNAEDSQYLDAIKHVALNTEYAQPASSVFTAVEFFKRYGILAKTEAEIQAANDYFVAQGYRGEVHLDPRASIPVTSGLNINVSRCAIVGHMAELDGSGMGSGYVLTLQGSNANPVTQAVVGVRDLVITGAGPLAAVQGLDMANTAHATRGSDNVRLVNVLVQDCIVAANIGTNGLSANFDNVFCYNCTSGLTITAVSGDSGAVTLTAPRFEDVGNCVTVSDVNSHVSILNPEISGSCNRVAEITNGSVSIFGGNISVADFDAVPFQITGQGANLTIEGGAWEVTGTATFDHWVNCGSGARASFNGISGAGMVTATEEFATGAGIVTLGRFTRRGSYDGCRVFHASQSAFVDGDFSATGDPLGDVFISEYTGSVVSRFLAGGTNAQVYDTEHHTGANSLQITRPPGASGGARVALAIPVRPGDRVGGRLYYSKPGSETGTVLFRKSFVTIRDNDDGLPGFGLREEFDNDSRVFTSSAVGWTEYVFGGEDDNVAPMWATHFVLEVDVTNFTEAGEASDLYIDAVNISPIG